MQQNIRKSSWFELFFDLVFVMVVGQLAHAIHPDGWSWGLILQVMVVFLAIFNIWLRYTYYTDLMEEDRWDAHWIVLSVGMFISLLLVNVIPETMQGNYTKILAILTFTQAHIGFLFLKQTYKLRNYRYFYLLGGMGELGISLMYGISAFYPIPLYVFLMELVIHSLLPGFLYILPLQHPHQTSHLDERYGLFTLIVIGELLAIMSVSLIHIDLTLFVMAKMGFVFLGILYMMMLYFSRTDETYITQVVASISKKYILKSNIYMYAHYFLYGALLFFTVSFGQLIEQSSIQRLNIMLIFGVLAVYLASLLVKQLVSNTVEPAAIVTRSITIVLCVSLAVFIPLTATFPLPSFYILLLVDGMIFMSPLLYNIVWKRFIALKYR